MKLVICGGGISGLSAAYYASQLLARNGYKVFDITLLEKSSKVGGWLNTNVKIEDRSGYFGPIYEFGPRSVRTAGLVGNNTLQFLSDLGLQNDIIHVKSTNVTAKNRLIYADKQLHVLPNSIWTALKKTKPFSKSLARCVIPGLIEKVPYGFESMHEVCSVRFGEEFANLLISSFCRGVFAADSRELSMKAAFPAMWKMLKPSQAEIPRRPEVDKPKVLNKAFLTNPFIKRVNKEKWTQWAPICGFQSFSESIADCLTKDFNVNIIRNTEVDSLLLKADNRIKLKLNTDELRSFNEIDDIDHVIFALPSHSLSKILRRSESSNDSSHALKTLGLSLNHISSVNVGVVNVEFEGPPGSVLPTVGFGHLVPATEPSKVLGIVYDSCAFPQQDRVGKPTTRLTCMMGGSWFQELFGNPDSVTGTALENAALESISEQLGINEEPLDMRTTVCRKCIPTYKIGHTSLVEDIEDVINTSQIPISLVGSSYWGVGINDCIFNSRVAVYDMLMKRGILD